MCNQNSKNKNKLLTISKIHKTNFKFKADQQGPLKKESTMMVPRRGEYSQLTGHICRVLFVGIRKKPGKSIDNFICNDQYISIKIFKISYNFNRTREALDSKR